MPDDDTKNDEGSGGEAESGGQQRVEGAVTVKMKDGSTKVMTPQEVQEALDRADEKERGFDKKFRDLAEVRKGAEYNERVVADMAAAQRGDLDAMRRLATYPELGITQEAVNQTLKAYEGHQEGDDGGAGDQKMATEELEPLDIGDFTPEMQKMFRDLKSQKDKGVREKVFGNLDEYLDKDEVLGGIITDKRSPEALVKRTREYAREVLLRRAAEAQRRGDTTWAPGPVEFQRVAQNVRSWLEDVASIRGEAVPGDAGERASGVLPGMGRSPSSRLESLHRAKEPPKRESSRDDGAYKVSLRERLQYALENSDGDNFGGGQ